MSAPRFASRAMQLALVALALAALQCRPDREPTAPVEIRRPESLGFVPAEGTFVVPVLSPVTCIFGEAMDAGTFPGKFFLRDDTGHDIPGLFASVETTVVFTPTQMLEQARIYRAELRGGVKDAHGNTIQADNVAVFADSVVLGTTWFYTEGLYSAGGFHHLFLRDRSEGSVRVLGSFNVLQVTVTGFSVPEGMLVSPDGQVLFVSNRNVNRVDAVSTASNTVVRNIGVAPGPTAMAAYGDTLYVLCVDASGRGALTKIRIATLDSVARVPLAFPGAKLAISNDGATLYTLDQSQRSLVLVNPGTGAIIRRLANAVQTSIITGDLMVHPTTGDVYVCNAKGFNIKATDATASSFRTVQTYPNGIEPVQMVFDPTGTAEYCVAAGRFTPPAQVIGYLTKYDYASGTPRDTITVSGPVKSVCSLPGGEVLYAVHSNSVLVVDRRTFTVLDVIEFSSAGIESIVASPQKFP